MLLDTWLAFVVAAFLISLSPGAGVVSCLAAGLRFGFARGVWNVAGLIAGLMFVMIVAAVGLGALLAASAVAFTITKWVGAAYLVWLGVQQWRAPAIAVDPDGAPLGGTPRDLVVRGFLVNATNPKSVIFMLAVLPQFIDPARPQLPQYLVCGATLCASDLVVMSAYTAFAAKALRLLRKPAQVRAMNRTFGGMLMTMGALLATFKRAA
ncbi:MAG: homoserine/homoserine lactone efflux protein [Burkholderiales bacterium]